MAIHIHSPRLFVGGIFEDRDGHHHRVTRRLGVNERDYKVGYRFETEYGKTYTEHGKQFIDQRHNSDLVKYVGTFDPDYPEGPPENKLISFVRRAYSAVKATN